MLKQKRRPAGFHGPVGDLGDLQLGIDLGGDARQLALALEQGDPFAEIQWRRHAASLGNRLGEALRLSGVADRPISAS
jgi:hypothetical protein